MEWGWGWVTAPLTAPVVFSTHFLARGLCYTQPWCGASLAPPPVAHPLVVLQHSPREPKRPHSHGGIAALGSSLGNLPGAMLLENQGWELAACRPLLSDGAVRSSTGVSRSAIK